MFPPAAEAKLCRNSLKHSLRCGGVSHSDSDCGPRIWECKIDAQKYLLCISSIVNSTYLQCFHDKFQEPSCYKSDAELWLLLRAHGKGFSTSIDGSCVSGHNEQSKTITAQECWRLRTQNHGVSAEFVCAIFNT